MKDIILTLVCTLTLLTCGCKSFMFSHNANQFANGQYVRVGVGDYGLIFGDGTLITQAVRENTEMVVEMQNGNEFTGGPTSEMDSVKAVRFRTGPQVTGYLVDLAGVASDAAINYVNAMPDMNKAQWDVKQASSSKQSGEKSTSDNYIDYLKEKLKGVIGDKETKGTITGDGDYNGLWQDASIEHQAALTSELLAISDNVTLIQEDGETIRDTLVHYAGRLAQLKAKGKSESKRILLDRCTVKDGKVTFLRYRLTDLQTGQTSDETCPSCYGVED